MVAGLHLPIFGLELPGLPIVLIDGLLSDVIYFMPRLRHLDLLLLLPPLSVV